MNIAETHPEFTLPAIALLDNPKFNRYATNFVTTSVAIARNLAERKYLEITSEGNGGSFARCNAGALRSIITVLAGNSTKVGLPHDALLLIEVWDELTNATMLVPVRELQNCRWVFQNGIVFVDSHSDNQWFFRADEKLTGPVPNPDSPVFRITIHVLQENSEARHTDHINGVARSAAQHVALMIPEVNQAAFEEEYQSQIKAWMETLLPMCRIGQSAAAEQSVRQIVLRCAAEYTKI